MTELQSQFDKDAVAEKEKPKAAVDLQTVSNYIERALKLEEEIEAMEATVSELRADYMKIIELDLPATMQQLSMDEFTLRGHKVTLKNDVYASISKANEDEAFGWLRSNGFGDIIKDNITVVFAAGEDEAAEKLNTLIDADEDLKRLPHERKQAIHAATLKAFVKEQLEGGKPLPVELFGVFQRTVAKIQRPKVHSKV